MVFIINYYYIITGPVSVGRLCVLLLLIVCRLSSVQLVRAEETKVLTVCHMDANLHRTQGMPGFVGEQRIIFRTWGT